MKALLRICFTVTAILLLFTVSTVQPVLAQTSQNTVSNYMATDVNPDVPQNMHSLTQIVTTEVIATLICQLSGIDVIQRNQSCLGIDPQTHKIGFVPQGSGGLIGATVQGINFTFNLPVHSGDYLHYMAGKFGITQKAYAQTAGVGFEGLKPLLALWVAFRNIVYLFFVIIFVLIGIAIMLRVQIDPRTVMTLENQLPKIVIGIILVTFSYAIAGFLIDAMWLITFLVINVIASTDTAAQGNPTLVSAATLNLLNGPLGYINEVLKSNSFPGVLDVAGTAIHATYDIIHNVITGTNPQQLGLLNPPDAATAPQCSFWDWVGTAVTTAAAPVNPIGAATNPCANQLLSNLTGQTVGSILLNILGWLIGTILGSLAGLIILIALLVTMFRVWFMLLQAYAYIILDVILAPFHIAAGLIPGSSIGFGSWLRGMAANLLIFPTTVAMFVLSRVLLDAFGYVNGAGTGGALFQPPLIGAFGGGGNANPLGAFVALVIIFATPSVLEIIKKALQVQENGLGAAGLAGMGVGAKLIRGGLSTGTAGFIDQTTGKFGPFRVGRLLNRI